MAYEAKAVGLHAPIKVRVRKEFDGVEKFKIIDATVGRLVLNEYIPQDLGFVDRSKEENEFKLEVDFLTDKKALGEIVDKCIKNTAQPKRQ